MATTKKTEKSSASMKVKRPAVRLQSLAFTEFEGEPREWRLGEVSFNQINLIVGKNSSGKSRLLNVVAGLAAMVSGRRAKVFQSGKYVCQFASEDRQYAYALDIQNGIVNRETLALNGKKLLERGKGGIGTIWAEKIGNVIDFETPPDQLAARARRDSIQHPFFEDLHTWASLLRHYQFGTPLGKDRLMVVSDASLGAGKAEDPGETSEVLELYARAFKEFGSKFDKQILKDMKVLGYDCTDVGAELVDSSIIQAAGNPLVWLFVQERNLKAKTHQINMSQGMFRALALVIHLNYALFRKVPRTLLIDDIGEGLDYSRAQAFIALLVNHSQMNDLQLVMTTNDRFVMNGVDLEHWGVLKREGSKVQLINKKNSPKIFGDFKTLGLNNFDFFATNFFEEGFK